MQLDHLSIKSMLIALGGVAKEFGLHKGKSWLLSCWISLGPNIYPLRMPPRHPNKLFIVIVRFQSHAWPVRRELKFLWRLTFKFLRISTLLVLERQHWGERRIIYKSNKCNLMQYFCTSLILLNCSEFELSLNWICQINSMNVWFLFGICLL